MPPPPEPVAEEPPQFDLHGRPGYLGEDCDDIKQNLAEAEEVDAAGHPEGADEGGEEVGEDGEESLKHCSPKGVMREGEDDLEHEDSLGRRRMSVHTHTCTHIHVYRCVYICISTTVPLGTEWACPQVPCLIP